MCAVRLPCRPLNCRGLQVSKVLLVDDVLTTGSTVVAATRALNRAGAEQVSVLTFARVASPGAETLYA
jgi:predicted amidophosphoribosyltransferase